jgi:hypothetical protein
MTAEMLLPNPASLALGALSGIAPIGDINVLGSPVVLNATAQCHLLKYCWLEVEVNAAIWANARTTGRNRSFCRLG